MVALIWMALVAAWIWHLVDLFAEVDPSELPPRARNWLATSEEDDERRRASAQARLEGLNANF